MMHVNIQIYSNCFSSHRYNLKLHSKFSKQSLFFLLDSITQFCCIDLRLLTNLYSHSLYAHLHAKQNRQTVHRYTGLNNEGCDDMFCPYVVILRQYIALAYILGI